ncbi:hypothetical protein QBC32DRAFT_374635 [Pseudoneurospora amorphoporcata]|uniref:Uncharacterized protein n=1 Tax=Pseudoneurospora amorphoporcata TaxID=241081 RepID=A0AAN6SAX8_9PEZI|nr:hypothetical protein QBC32DRAFT_374635 [Pseudoneurospora amorphoporcata]
MVMLFDGKLYATPLNEKEIKNAIDIGIGIDSWIDLRLLTSYFSYNSDFADDHPNCNVIGTDISLIQPSWVPPNASFEINNASKEWTYQENYFDFIHIRWLTGVPLAPWSDDEKMKQLGLYQSVALTYNIEGFLVYFMPNYLGWTPKEIANYAVTIRREFREAKIHSNIRWRMVRAQKPLDA